MKSLLTTSFAVLVLGVASAHAQTPPPAWQGSVTITKLAGGAACDNVGVSVGSLAVSIYRPHFTTGGPAGLAILTLRSGAVILDNTGTHTTLNGTTTYDGYALTGRASVSVYNGTSNFTVKPGPANLKPTTKQVTITGTISNFFDNTGCTATIEGSYFLRP